MTAASEARATQAANDYAAITRARADLAAPVAAEGTDELREALADPLVEIKAAVAAMTVHLLVNPDDEAAVRAAAEGRRDLPPLEIHTSRHASPPTGQMYVWTGDQVAGYYSIRRALGGESRG